METDPVTVGQQLLGRTPGRAGRGGGDFSDVRVRVGR